MQTPLDPILIVETPKLKSYISQTSMTKSIIHSSFGAKELDTRASPERHLKHVDSFKRIHQQSKKVIPLVKPATSKSQRMLQHLATSTDSGQDMVSMPEDRIQSEDLERIFVQAQHQVSQMQASS